MRLIADYRKNYPAAELAAVPRNLAALARQAEQTGLLAELRGCEEAAAAVHLRALTLLSRSPTPFADRRMHPPPDPFHTLLSLGYKLAMREPLAMVRCVAGSGRAVPADAVRMIEPLHFQSPRQADQPLLAPGHAM